MDIIFGTLQSLAQESGAHIYDEVSAVVTGERDGIYLSKYIQPEMREGLFLKERTQKQGDCARCCCPNYKHSVFVRVTPTNKAQSLHVLSSIKKDMKPCEAQELGAKIFKILSKAKEKNVCLDFSAEFDPVLVAHIAAGLQIRSYVFDKYKTKKDDVFKIEHIHLLSCDQEITETAYNSLYPVIDAMAFSRTLSNEAPNVLYPESFAKIAKEIEECKIEILDERDMQRLGMEALLSVGQGSEKESRLVICQWNGGEKGEAPVALVGKGVTFDSGGISLKPSKDMHEMKEDMTGAALVLTTVQMAARLKLPINIVGVMGLVENMPSGSASRPSDIVTSLSGQTIEIQNTDAEGRLVLADALYYAVSQYHPHCVIDFATLTGAIQIALGQEYAGLFSNNTKLAKALTEAGQEVKERLWELPLGPEYDKDIDSDIADVRNVGAGRGAGSITAAQFLQRFVEETPWAHIDIAAVTYDKKERPLTGNGFTAFGVRLMHAFLKNVTKNKMIFEKQAQRDYAR